MFIRVKDRKNGKKSIQIVENHRRGDNVQQKIVRHVGQAVTEREVETLKKLAQSIILEISNQRQPVLPAFKPEDIYTFKKRKQPVEDQVKINDLREEQRIIEGIGDIFGKLYSDLGFTNLISKHKKDQPWNNILKSCVLARLANPVSKKRTASLLAEKEEEIKEKIGQTTLSLFGGKVDVLFFDVTTLYFESVIANQIRDFGFSKDCKFKEVQIVLALVTTAEGLPINYELFAGNIYEGHTLIKMIESLKTKFEVDNLLLIADRAMFSNDNLELMEKEGINYIVAARLKRLSKETRQDIIESNDYRAAIVENELHWIKEYNYKERRLLVSYNSNRARKDASDRQRLIERLLKKAKDGKVKIKDIISNHGTKKYLSIKNDCAAINESRIEEDAKWDGLHGVISNVKDKSATEILSRYRGLWQIEEAFRLSKHDLKMRPIYHWRPSRIKAHIAICFIAFTLAKQAIYRMKHQQMPMSFEQIREELLHVQASIMMDISTKKKYVIPSHTTVNQKKIYQTFGLKRSGVPYLFEK
jgi:transposase